MDVTSQGDQCRVRRIFENGELPLPRVDDEKTTGGVVIADTIMSHDLCDLYQ